ncbi:MFS transporter [Corynebacterium uterequi]|uniref:Sugar phosphate permease n=1 Tax=Corynebacterium uterequi TaxID=1072256 RepID=A0A0G3HEU8_9CORY|nr:MFS transporter [Corynebacterium uterequi]AKK10498.1 sugar phosphate permease [Corynebacterium uterequi]
MSRPTTTYRGDNRALTGFILGLLTFWLFAQTLLNTGPSIAEELGMSAPTMTTAIALSSLLSGMLIVAWGGLADNLGRVRIFTLGCLLNIIGCLLLAVAAGALAVPLFLLGRILQGMSIGAIMPSSMALLGAYWDGDDRERASSLWAFGTFGGSGLASIVGGVLANSAVGWRGTFLLSAAFSLAAILLTRHIPESRANTTTNQRFDIPGVITLAIGLLALQLLITRGSTWGWASTATILAAVAAAGLLAAFFTVERRSPNPLVRLGVFRNRGFTAATISNFLVNLSVGIIPLTLWALQQGHHLSTATAGYLTLAYPIVLILFLKISVNAIHTLGAKMTMAAGPGALAVATVLMSLTFLPSTVYYVLVVIGFGLFGAGLALYATPSISMALSELPADQTGAGSGVYKMASSLGGGIGVAISGSVYTAIATTGNPLDAARIGLYVNIAFLVAACLLVLTMLGKKTSTR